MVLNFYKRMSKKYVKTYVPRAVNLVKEDVEEIGLEQVYVVGCYNSDRELMFRICLTEECMSRMLDTFREQSAGSASSSKDEPMYK